MARVDIRPFVLGWLKDVRGATAPDGGWRTLDEIRAGLQRQGIQASAPECRKVLGDLFCELLIDSHRREHGRPSRWRFLPDEEHEQKIETRAARIFGDAREKDEPDWIRFAGDPLYPFVTLSLDTLMRVCRDGAFRIAVDEGIHAARKKARETVGKSSVDPIEVNKARKGYPTDAPKDGGS